MAHLNYHKSVTHLQRKISLIHYKSWYIQYIVELWCGQTENPLIHQTLLNKEYLFCQLWELCNFIYNQSFPYSVKLLLPTRRQYANVRYHSIFKTATIVYKVLCTENQSYFGKSISGRTCSNDTRCGKSDNMFLNVPLFSPSVYASMKQFSHSLSFDGLAIWNDVHIAASTGSFWKQLNISIYLWLVCIKGPLCSSWTDHSSCWCLQRRFHPQKDKCNQLARVF